MISPKKLKVSSVKIQEWEQGDSRPTLNQAEKIANNLHIPFGYLFLKNALKKSYQYLICEQEVRGTSAKLALI